MEIILILVMTMLGGLFAMAEIATISARPFRLEQMAARGSHGAAAALRVSRSPTRFLSTVQIAITLLTTGLGVFGGARVARSLEAALTGAPLLAAYAGPLSVGLVWLAVTYCSLVLGELVPKRLALAWPERIAAGMAPLMGLLSRLAAPAVGFLSVSTDALLLPFGVGREREAGFSEDEVRALVRHGAKTGALDTAQQQIVERVLSLADRTAGSIMVPRAEIAWLDADDTPERILAEARADPHSHLPLCRGRPEQLLGVLHLKDLVRAGMAPPDPASLARRPVFVPESMPALKILDVFKQRRTHVAFVTNEFGGLEGMVTLNDVVQAVVGQIALPEEHDDPLVVRRDDGSYLLDGMLPIHELLPLMGLETLPGLDEAPVQTVGGFVTSRLGHIPRAGEHFTCEGHRFEVMDMDRRRVDKVMVSRLALKEEG